MFFRLNLRLHRVQSLSVQPLLVMSCLVVASRPAQATEPVVAFDVPLSVVCRDVTTDDFADAHPNEKLIEASFHVSTLVAVGSADDVDHLLLTVSSPARRLRTIEFLPKTELSAELAGPVSVVEVSNQNKSLKANLGGRVGFQYGLADVSASPAASTGVSHHQSSQETFERLPAQHLLLASGTANAGHGVFFKVKASSQTTLEGDQTFVCRFAVPRDWRGDWVKIECRAYGYKKDAFRKKLRPCGESNVLVGLYAAGDVDAQAAAEQLETAQMSRSRTSTARIEQPAWKASWTSLKRTLDTGKRTIDAGDHLFGLSHIFKPCSKASCSKKPHEANSLKLARDALSGLSGGIKAGGAKASPVVEAG